MTKDWKFPVYRKYPNNKSFFKIHSLDHFEEIVIMGTKQVKHLIFAKIHPDRMRILDMLEIKDNMWLESSKEEFDQNSN